MNKFILLLTLALMGCAEQSQHINADALSPHQLEMAQGEASKWCGASQQGFCPKFDGAFDGHRIELVSREIMNSLAPAENGDNPTGGLTVTDPYGVTIIYLLDDDSDHLFRFRLLHELGHWGALRPAYDHLGDWNVMSANPDRRATVPTAADVEYVGL